MRSRDHAGRGPKGNRPDRGGCVLEFGRNDGRRRILRVVAYGRTPERRDRLTDPPSRVRVTVIVAPRRRWFERPLRALGDSSRARGVTSRIAVIGALAAIAGAAGGELAGSKTRARHGRPTKAVALPEAVAYRFPLGCLGATLLGRSSLRADVGANRTGPCWHYGVYVTAVLRRVDGAWRLMLDARSDSCPSVPLPATIRALLAECAKTEVGVARSPKRKSPRTAAR
jgi:hypothetical protein